MMLFPITSRYLQKRKQIARYNRHSIVSILGQVNALPSSGSLDPIVMILELSIDFSYFLASFVLLLPSMPTDALPGPAKDASAASFTFSPRSSRLSCVFFDI